MKQLNWKWLQNLGQWMRNIRQTPIFTWVWLRGIGQLQILNRVSIVLLIVVPMLAATWPAVRAVVNRYNHAAIRAQAALDVSAARIDESVKRFERLAANVSDETAINRSVEIQGHVAALRTSVDEYLHDLHPKPIETPHLPCVWVLTFFAALFVLGGRTLFELYCPDIIRANTMSEYVEQKKLEFARAPSFSMLQLSMDAIKYDASKTVDATQLIQEESDGQEKLALAKSEIRTKIGQCEGVIGGCLNPGIKSDSKDSARIKFHISNLRELRKDLRAIEQPDRGDHGPDFRRRMGIVEEGAKCVYNNASRQKFVSLVIGMMSYAAAILAIIVIIFNQSKSVLSAAGFM